MKWLPALLVVFIGLFAVCGVHGQGTDISSMDFSKIRVDDISDSQLREILHRAEQEGLTPGDLERIALARGMMPSEVIKFRGRLSQAERRMRTGETDEDRRDRVRDAYGGRELSDDDDPFGVLVEERRRGARRGRDASEDRERSTPDVRRQDEQGRWSDERRGSDDSRRSDERLGDERGLDDDRRLGYDRSRDDDWRREDEREVDRDDFYDDSLEYAEDEDALFSRRAPRRLQIFGRELFRNEELTFEPSLNIPAPEDYQIAPGDELVVDVWGSAEMRYSLPVRNDGTVRIENVGPVHVSGLRLDEAEERVLGRLSQIYGGLNATGPSENNVFADVSLGKIRTIKVHVTGEVTHPGSYTLPAMATVLNAMYVCSGPNKTGTYRRIQVIRGGGVITEFDVYDFLVDGRLSNNVNLRDQDIIKVDPYVGHVEIRGEIKREAIYEIVPGETLGDLLAFSGGFSGSAYTRRMKVYRNTDTEKRIIGVSLEEFTTFQLRGGDEILVEPILKRFENRVEIRGAVYRDGEYQLEDVGTVSQLIERAEGLRGDAFLSRGQIYRTRDDLTLEVISFNLGDLVQNPQQNDVALHKDDVVVITSIFDLKEDRYVEIRGAVQDEGKYPFMEQTSLKDIIVMAGGLREEASLERVEVARRRTANEDGSSGSIADIFYFDLDRDLSLTETDETFVLEPFDEIFVRRSPNYIEQRNVIVTGEVMYPGTYTIRSKNDRISTVIERAGGLTPEAYPAGASLFRNYKDVGAVGIDLERIQQDPMSEHDLLVENEDSIHVPLHLETVKVSGAVFHPYSVRYSAGLSFRDYIDKAGGYTDRADLENAYVVSASGSVTRVKDTILSRRYPRVEPGAEIVVPTQAEKQRLSTQERTLIFSSIVSIAAVVTTTIFQLTR